MIIVNDCKENVKNNKSELRNFAKNLRKEVFSYEKNKKILTTLRNFDKYKSAKNIMAFYPLEYEIDLRELFVKNEDKKNWFLPKVIGNKLAVCPYHNETSLKTGAFNIKEPQTKEITDFSILDLIIIPALCIDKNGNRLGYGKGFYDKFLAENNNTNTIVPIFEELIADKIPHDEFDYKITFIAVENEVCKTF